MQVRGWAGKRQVPNVRYALQHNLGLGGAVVVTAYTKGFPSVPTPAPDRLLGYNAAVELRGVTPAEILKYVPPRPPEPPPPQPQPRSPTPSPPSIPNASATP